MDCVPLNDIKQVGGGGGDEDTTKGNVRKRTNEPIGFESKSPSRRGKYHKKLAPKPPTPPIPPTNELKNCGEGLSAIKATLVLKSGIVKPLGPIVSRAADDDNGQSKRIFLHSPKIGRRFMSSCKDKLDSSLSKLMHLSSKKENHCVVDNNARSSWHEFSSTDSTLNLPNSKARSKSDSTLTRHGSDLGEKSSSLSNPLTRTPLGRRRLRIIRGFVDEMID